MAPGDSDFTEFSIVAVLDRRSCRRWGPMLDHAVALRSPVATIVHSDRGSQFRSREFVHALSHNGLHVGACGGNAATESFFALLQRNVLDRKRWFTRAELRLAIVAWIERTYH